MQTSDLAVRAVNQYRRRDVVAYLALRYYLANAATRSERWVEEVAPKLVAARAAGCYYPMSHFKCVAQDGEAEHRTIWLPDATEALAEAALLGECAKHPGVFGVPECVYSYVLPAAGDCCGMFVPYMRGLRARHSAIAAACDAAPDSIVRFTDIKAYYPSITRELAERVWTSCCDAAPMPAVFRELGLRLISDHVAASPFSPPGLLVGPMFSHLLGNLVLRELDTILAASLPVVYLRYVDDITLVGAGRDVELALQRIRSCLNDLHLHLHGDENADKNQAVKASEWVKGRHDFDDSRRSVSWMALVHDMKRFLLVSGEQRDALAAALSNEGFRLPVPTYAAEARERHMLERVRELAWRPWYRDRTQKLTVSSIVAQAHELRRRYAQEFEELRDGMDSLRGHARRRRVPKLRYRAGRLVYLANDDSLLDLAHGIGDLEELTYHAAVMEAVASGSVDSMLALGANAAQAVAQPLAAGTRTAKLQKANLDQTELQALSVLALNGVSVIGPGVPPDDAHPLWCLARTGAGVASMTQGDRFVRELACLHGATSTPRHAATLASIMDPDEELALDTVSQLQQSMS